MFKALLIALLLGSVGTVQAQQPPTPPAPARVSYVWKIVLFNFLNQRQGSLPGQYPDHDSCQLALDGMGYNAIDVLGNHGKCNLVPVFGGKRHHHRPAIVKALG